MHSFETHDVLDQTPPFGDVNLIATNQPLLDALKANGVDAEAEGLIAFGAAWGSAERLDIGRLPTRTRRSCARMILAVTASMVSSFTPPTSAHARQHG